MAKFIDWPIGTAEERLSVQPGALPGQWDDANPFLNRYAFGYHTGNDLNLESPHWNSDAGMPIYAPCDGIVTFSGIGDGKSWGWLIIIEGHTPSGTAFYCRIAHVNHKQFKVPATGDAVSMGQEIALVGNADGYYVDGGDHLHFDVSYTSILKTNPSDWPGLDKQRVVDNYADPKLVIAHQALPGQAITDAPEIGSVLVVSQDSVRVRGSSSIRGKIVGNLSHGDTLIVVGKVQQTDGYDWLPVSTKLGNGWSAWRKSDRTDTLLVPAPKVPRQVRYTTDALRVRSGPGTTFRVLGTLPKGTLVFVDEDDPQHTLNGFVHLADGYKGFDAWVSEAYLTSQIVPPPPVVSRGSKLGLHIMDNTNTNAVLGMLRDLNSANRPMRGVLLMKQGWQGELNVSGIKAASPSTEVMVRYYNSGWEDQMGRINWGLADLEQTGYDSFIQYNNHFITQDDRQAEYHQFINEESWGVGTPSFFAGAVRAADELGLRIAIGGFSVGTPALPGQENADFWGELGNILRKAIQRGHIYMRHNYIVPDPGGDWTSEWTMTRHRKDILALGVADLPICFGEFGTEYAGRTDIQAILAGWKAADDALAQDPGVKWAALWTVGNGGSSGWDHSLLDNILPSLKNYMLHY